jgi:lysophospholipase L1-like esterase
VSTTAEDSGPQNDPTARALRQLGLVLACFAALGLATYALPGTKRLRPWLAEEGIPIARMFRGAPAALPGFAEAATHGNGDLSAAQVASSLGAQVAANLGGDFEAKGKAAGPTAAPGARIAPSEYEGIKQQIEHPEALSAFFAKLARTAAHEPGAITRVAHYGDSAVAADAITSTARRRLQQRFGDAGHGFLLMAHGEMHYIHRDVLYFSGGDWDIYSIVENPLRPGFYGYGGVQTRAQAGARGFVGTVKEGELGRSVSRFELFYQRYRGGGVLELRVDGKKQTTIHTNADQPADGFEAVELEDGPHSFSVRASGSPSRVFGVTMERTVPGVVYDSLGLVGARAERLLNAEPEHMRSQIAHRDPDLLVLSFGGNETDNPWLNLEQYERRLVQVVQLMRSAKPAMPCLLLGPLDQAERNQRGQIVTIKSLPKIVEVQRKVSAAQQCAFFDAYAAMGGAGSMAAWLKSRPHLATSDLRHATPAGYEVIGNMYYKALLKALADYFAARGSS